MNFMKIAWRDISSIFKNRFIRVSVTAIIIVPLLYSMLYLYAFWDPYSRLTSMQVAVVNLDKGGTKDGEAVSYGKDLVDKLKDNNKVGWRFVTLKEAEDGVKNKGYYAMFVVPENFTDKVLSAKNGKPEEPHIIYTANEKKNFLAAQINGKVLVELKSELTKNITSEYTKVTFDSLYEVKDGMQKASDGSKELYDGISKLNDKVPELSDGVNKLYDGSGDLSNGLTAAKEGAAQLYYGADKLNSALSQVNGGAVSINGGLGQLKDQLPALSKGTSDLAQGSSQLNGGLKELNTQVPALVKGVSDLKDGSGLLKDNIKKFNDEALQGITGGISGLNYGLNTTIIPGAKGVSEGAVLVSGGVDAMLEAQANVQKNLQQYLADHPGAIGNPDVQALLGIISSAQTPEKAKAADDLQKGAEKVADGSAALYNGLNGDFKVGLATLNATMPVVNENANKIYNGAVALNSGAVQINEKVPALASGIDKLYKGSTLLNGGVNDLNSKVPVLSGGVEALYSGSSELSSGIKQIYDGSAKLKSSIAKPEEVKNIKEKEATSTTTLFNGLTQLNDGGTQLKDGLGTLKGNIPELQDGVGKLSDGSKELSDKLKEGSDKLNKNLVNDSDTMASFVSEPISIDEDPMNPVKNYGTGFTPYFIPLSLWVGALMMFFVITDKVDDDIKASPASLVLGKFLSYGYIGIIQAVLASSVVLVLGLRPSSIPLYFGFNILLSLVFIAIIQSLVFLLGQVGRLLSIVLLILQLTACAGTFPLEVVPRFFKIINPFMPFTYAVSGLRETISGLDHSVFMKDVSVLAVVMAVFLVISVAMKGHADKIQDKIRQQAAM